MPFNDWTPIQSVLYRMPVATKFGFDFTRFGIRMAGSAETGWSFSRDNLRNTTHELYVRPHSTGLSCRHTLR